MSLGRYLSGGRVGAQVSTQRAERESNMVPAHFSTQGSDAICASLVFCLCDIS